MNETTLFSDSANALPLAEGESGGVPSDSHEPGFAPSESGASASGLTPTETESGAPQLSVSESFGEDEITFSIPAPSVTSAHEAVIADARSSSENALPANGNQPSVGDNSGVSDGDLQVRNSDISAPLSGSEAAELSSLNRLCGTAFSSLSQLPDRARYEALRQSGLTPLEAMRATAFDLLLTRELRKASGKEHLNGSAMRPSTGATMSRSDLAELRRWGLDHSERELERLWLSTEHRD